MKKEISIISNEKLAAIAIALYKYSKSLSPNKPMTLTFNKASKMNSPWNSKFYGLRQIPNKNN